MAEPARPVSLVDPFSVLHYDVCREILEHLALPAEPPCDYHLPTGCPLRAAITVSSVCQSWRRLALAMPRLWSRVVLRCSHFGVFKIMLERSQSTPLHLFVVFPPDTSAAFEYNLLDVLSTNRERISTLKMWFATTPFLSKLHTVEFTRPNMVIKITSEDFPTQPVVIAASPRTLWAQGFTVAPLNMESLVKLVIATPISVTTLQAFLNQTPLLRVCISTDIRIPNKADTICLEHPNLNSLSLHSGTVSRIHFDFSKLPSLKAWRTTSQNVYTPGSAPNLRAAFVRHRDGENGFPVFTSLRTSPSLTHLHLEPDCLLPFLEHAHDSPQVKHLFVKPFDGCSKLGPCFFRDCYLYSLLAVTTLATIEFMGNFGEPLTAIATCHPELESVEKALAKHLLSFKVNGVDLKDVPVEGQVIQTLRPRCRYR